MYDLLIEFHKVFKEPRELPHIRSHDHTIVLKEETSPINVHLYWYLYYQKTEIENIVKDDS